MRNERCRSKDQTTTTTAAIVMAMQAKSTAGSTALAEVMGIEKVTSKYADHQKENKSNRSTVNEPIYSSNTVKLHHCSVHHPEPTVGPPATTSTSKIATNKNLAHTVAFHAPRKISDLPGRHFPLPRPRLGSHCFPSRPANRPHERIFGETSKY